MNGGCPRWRKLLDTAGVSRALTSTKSCAHNLFFVDVYENVFTKIYNGYPLRSDNKNTSFRKIFTARVRTTTKTGTSPSNTFENENSLVCFSSSMGTAA
jgi:hypothetical protein